MNRSTFGSAVITLAAVLGVIAGTVLPKPAHAAFIYNVYVHPTADTLSCGWHDGP